jgi:hypothetical protein
MPDVRLIDANALRKDIHTSYSDDLGILEHIDNAPTIDAIPREKWNELKETIIEMRDSGGTATQNVACKFLTNLMEILEKEGKNDGLN